MPDLKNREIFATGKWNNIEFSDADLEDIVENFEKLKTIHKVPLKFGHNDEQPITDGQPAIGWISRVFKQGNKLLADFTDMPKTVFDAIKKKLYRSVSVELLFNVDHDGNRFNHVLDAVALLGADHPAVNTLADLDNLLATRTSFAGGHRVAFKTFAGNKIEVETGGKSMDEETKKLIAAAVSEAIAPFKTELDDLKKENATLKEEKGKLEAKRKEDEAEQLKKEVKMARDAVTEVLNAAVKSKSLAPAARETYERQIGLDDDNRVLDIKIDDVKALFNVKVPDNKSEGRVKSGDEIDDIDDPGEALMSLVYQNMEKTGETDFNKAFSRVAPANPKLHRAYLDSNGVKGRDE